MLDGGNDHQYRSHFLPGAASHASEQAKTDADRAAEWDALNSILQLENLADRYGSTPSDGGGTHGSSSPFASNGPGSGTPPLQPDGFSAYSPLAIAGADGGSHPASGGNGGAAAANASSSVPPVNEPTSLLLNAGATPLAAFEQTPVAVVPALTLSDADSSTLLWATVQLTGNYQPGEDVLSFANTARIQGTFNAATGTLTLTTRSGERPTLADFAAALRSATYTDTSDNPSPLSVTVRDPDGAANGHDTAGSLELVVNPVNDAPIISAAQVAGELREDVATDSHGRLHVDGGHIQFLRAGQTITETYAVTISDGHGGLATRNVTITITGGEDAPVLAAASGVATEAVGASAQQITLAGTLSVADLDIGDTPTASIVNSPVVRLDGHAFALSAGATSLINNALSFQHGVTSNGGVAGIGWTYDPSAANLDFLMMTAEPWR